MVPYKKVKNSAIEFKKGRAYKYMELWRVFGESNISNYALINSGKERESNGGDEKVE